MYGAYIKINSKSKMFLLIRQKSLDPDLIKSFLRLDISSIDSYVLVLQNKQLLIYLHNK